MLSSEQYGQLCRQVEGQTPRQLKRFLDFDKKLRSGQGLDQLRQWCEKILLDNGDVYAIVERSLAFEIIAALEISHLLPTLQGCSAEVVTIAGEVDKISLYRRILDRGATPGRRLAIARLFEARYRKIWSWILSSGKRGSAGRRDEQYQLTARFLAHLDYLDPIDPGSGVLQIEALERTIANKEDSLARKTRELDAARQRADRAVERLEGREAELSGMGKQLQSERDNGEKLRQERSRRIKLEREAREKGRELEDLKREFVKLDGRLHEMAGKRATSAGLDVSAIRDLDAACLLGVSGSPADEDLGQVRRRFAAAFHSDRASQLPAWVADLFDQLLGIVNEACDRVHK